MSGIYRSVRKGWLFAAITALCAVPVAASAGGPAGVDIKIRALNRDTSDTPFCGDGGGMVGDRLSVDAFMDQDGDVTGTAVLKRADGTVVEIELDRLFGFEGGLILQKDGPKVERERVAIWMTDAYSLGPTTPALINVEIPQDCKNTLSTFTPGVDLVTMQIKFK